MKREMKVEYKPSMYRVYKRLLFWKCGQWRPLAAVHTVLIRLVEGQYELYFVHKHGYDKVYRHRSLEQTRKKAAEFSQRYGWSVEERV